MEEGLWELEVVWGGSCRSQEHAPVWLCAPVVRRHASGSGSGCAAPDLRAIAGAAFNSRGLEAVWRAEKVQRARAKTVWSVGCGYMFTL
eukprot:6248901-Prymnesium_polylepis.1